MDKKLIREMRFMMERLESPRMTDSEVQKKYKKLNETDDFDFDFDFVRGGDHIFELIMDKEKELENDPKYKMYEKKYLKNKLINTITTQMGMDMSDLGEDEVESLVDMFSSIMDVSKESSKRKNDTRKS